MGNVTALDGFEVTMLTSHGLFKRPSPFLDKARHALRIRCLSRDKKQPYLHHVVQTINFQGKRHAELLDRGAPGLSAAAQQLAHLFDGAAAPA
jgi:hypothetical protein